MQSNLWLKRINDLKMLQLLNKEESNSINLAFNSIAWGGRLRNKMKLI